MNWNFAGEKGANRIRATIFPMYGMKQLHTYEIPWITGIQTFDSSKEKIDRERFRKMYFEKHFMEEMLKAKNMSSSKK